MSVPVQYFQVTGAAIPTLLVAVAISAEFGKKTVIKESPWPTYARSLLVLLVMSALVVTGETSSFIALARGHGTKAEAGFASVPIWICLLFIIYTFIEDLLNELPRRVAWVVYLVIVGGLCVAQTALTHAIPS